MTRDGAARSSCNYDRARKTVPSEENGNILSDWERGCTLAGIAVGFGFGLMFVLSAILF